MYRVVLVASYLCCILSVSTEHSNPLPAPVKPNIAIDEERRALGEAKLREIKRQSESTPCWKEAVSQLDASCKDLADMQQNRLAVSFAAGSIWKNDSTRIKRGERVFVPQPLPTLSRRGMHASACGCREGTNLFSI